MGIMTGIRISTSPHAPSAQQSLPPLIQFPPLPARHCPLKLPAKTRAPLPGCVHPSHANTTQNQTAMLPIRTPATSFRAQRGISLLFLSCARPDSVGRLCALCVKHDFSWEMVYILRILCHPPLKAAQKLLQSAAVSTRRDHRSLFMAIPIDLQKRQRGVYHWPFHKS